MCRAGAACDFIVEDEDMRGVAEWIIQNLPFDRMYFYWIDRSIHISYGAIQKRGINHNENISNQSTDSYCFPVTTK